MKSNSKKSLSRQNYLMNSMILRKLILMIEMSRR